MSSRPPAEAVAVYLTDMAEGFAGGTARAVGSCSSAYNKPPNGSLWILRAALATDTTLVWGSDHGDEVIFVLHGSVEAAGRIWDRNSALVVEDGVPTELRAVSADTEIINFGPNTRGTDDPGPLGAPEVAGHTIHGVGPGGSSHHESLTDGLRIRGRYYFDSSCSTCRATLLRVRADPGFRQTSHAHSADEVIYVLDGEIRVGRDVIAAGEAISVPGGRRYGFVAGNDGCEYINYRRQASVYTGRPGVESHLEVVANLQPTFVDEWSSVLT